MDSMDSMGLLNRSEASSSCPHDLEEKTSNGYRLTPFCDHDGDHSSDMSDDSTFRVDEDGLPHVLMHQNTAECFHAWVFVQQLLLHIFIPFSIPFFLIMGEEKTLANTLIWPCPCGAVAIFWNLIPMIVYANVVLFALYYESFVENDIGVAEVVLVPCLAMITHRSMIALKYSGLSPEEYELWQNAPKRIAAKWTGQMQLISTWLPVPDDILLMEMEKGSHFQGADLHQIFFEQDVQDVSSWRSWQVWDEMLTGHCTNSELRSSSLCPRLTRVLSRELSVNFSPGLRRVSAHQVLHILYRRAADEIREQQKFIVAGVFALFPALFPIAWRCVKCYGELGDEAHVEDVLGAGFGKQSHVVSYCVVQAALMAYAHGSVSSVFAVIGILHYRRMQMVMESVRQLTRRLPCLYPNLPQVQLAGPTAEANVRAVVACFETVLRLGSRYQNRVDSYIGTLALASALGLGFVLVGVIVGAHSQLNAGICVCLVVICGVTAAVNRMILWGRLANENFGKLSVNLCRARWHNSVTGAPDSEAADQVMSLAMEKLALLAETEPVTVAALIPTADLGYSVVSVVGTFVLYILGKLLHVELPL